MANETPTTPTTTAIKKKKKWYTIVAPKEMNNVVIGETLSADPALLQGRGINANLMTLTDDMKKQNLVARFKILTVKEGVAETELVAYYITPAHVRRLAKRARDKVEDSFKCQTKDGKTIAIKPFILIKTKLQRTLLTALRMTARDVLAKEAANETFLDLTIRSMDGELQKQLKAALKKVYPVMMAEIRAIELA